MSFGARRLPILSQNSAYVPSLVVEAQRDAEHAFPPRFDGEDVLRLAKTMLASATRPLFLMASRRTIKASSPLLPSDTIK